jgi:prolyl 4-hydroxylase
VPAEAAEIFAVGDFMSAEECVRMCGLIDACARPSTVFDLDYSSGYRTSFSGDVDPLDPFVRKISRRIDDLLGLEPEWGESIQGQRYMPGQQFQPHHDWFHPGTTYWDKEMGRGGQRSYTAMVFLNEVRAGGTTEFTDLGLAIEPRPGVLLAWNNADADGVPNPLTIHAGRPVVEGVKYIITKWYRTKPWR